MADGTLVPIEDVDVGDMVWSANPVTGEAGPEQVVATIVGHGTKTLVEITTNTATVTATGGHPFWVTNQHRWTGAQDIQPGDHLLNQHRDTVVVDQIAITKAANQTVHNLTITNHHTYAVGPNHDAILTHNCSAPRTVPGIKPGSAGGPTAGQRFPASVRREALEENPSACVYCHLETDKAQVDHAIPRSRGGDATIDNAQTTCPHCNASKRDRDFPVNPPADYRGPWPPPWWPGQ